MGVLFLLFFVLVAHASSSAYNTQTPHDSRLLILFIDGLRWDYFNYLDETGGVGQMRMRGCHVPRVRPIFPSNCYANVHALFAGHNSTRFANTFNDTFEAKYTHSDLLWNRAVLQGKRVKLFHLPFCSDLVRAGIDCVEPTEEQPTSLKSTLEDALLTLTNSSTDLVVVYYGELDRIAHTHGPSSEELKHGDAILEIDEAISNVIQTLQMRENADLNFAVVADHGMTDFKDFLALDRAFKWKDIEEVVNLGTAVGLWPKPGVEKNLTAILSGASQFRVYTPKTIPMTSWDPSALPPLVLIAEPGYIFQMNHHSPATWDHLQSITSKKVSNLTPIRPRGAHGYLPDVADMHTTFLGYGPAFASGCGLKSGGKAEPFYTYNIFPLLSVALPGRVDTTATMEAAGAEIQQMSWEVKLLVGFLFMAFAVVLVLGIALRRLLSIRRKNPDVLLVDDISDDDEDEKREMV